MQALPEEQLRDIYQQAAAADQAQQTPQQQQKAVKQKAEAWEGQQVDGAERLMVCSFGALASSTELDCSWQAAACKVSLFQVR